MKATAQLILLLAFLVLSCDPPPAARVVHSIWIENASPEPIVAILGYQYPDTALPLDKSGVAGILPGIKVPFDRALQWQQVFEELPKDTLSIFIIDKAIYENTEWSKIADDYSILERFDVSYQEIEAKHHIITYQ